MKRVAGKTARRAAVVASAAVVSVLFFGCPAPFDVGRVDRPEFDNPFDPEARIPLLTILNGVDDLGAPLVPDAALRSALAGTGAQYTTDVTNIDAPDAGIVSLDGLQYFPNLYSLHATNSDADPVNNNTISDLSPLIGLQRFEELSVSGDPSVAGVLVDNDFSAFDLSLLATLPRLRSLDISYAGVTSLTGLEAVGSLRSLAVSGPELSASATLPLPAMPNLTDLRYDDSAGGGTVPADLSFLSGCPGLETLSMRSGEVTSLSGTDSLSDIRELYLDNNASLTDLTGLSSLSRLELLSVNSVQAELTPVSGLQSLAYLNAADRSGGVPIGTLTDLPSIEALDLNNSNIIDTDLVGLSALTELQSLSMAGSLVTDLTGLSTLVGLKTLDLSYSSNALSLAPLASLLLLEELHASDFALSATEDLSFVAGLSNIRFFEVRGVTATYPEVILDGFAGSDLEELYLSGITLDSIGDFEFAATTPRLRNVDVENSGFYNVAAIPPVVGLSPFAGTELQTLVINGVQLTSFEDFSFALGLPDLGTLAIGNAGTGFRPFLDLGNLRNSSLGFLSVNYADVYDADLLPATTTYLRLADCNVATPVGGGLLDEIAQNLDALVELDLSYNPGIATVAALTAPSSVLYSLQTLDVRPVSVGGLSDDGTVNGIAALDNLPSLSTVYLFGTDAAVAYALYTTPETEDVTGIYPLTVSGIADLATMLP